MSRLRSIDWLTVRRRHIHSNSRQLHFEQLEERRFLSISPWSAVEHSAISLTKQTYVEAADFDAYTLNSQQLEASLGAPVDSVTMGDDAPSPKQIALPNPAGGLDWFSVVEAQIMAPELAAEFPEIHTYRGQGITDPTETLAFDITPAGFHAQVLSPNGSYYIDPYYYLDDSQYAVYSAQNMYVVPDFSECGGDADCACSDEKQAAGLTIEIDQAAAASAMSTDPPITQVDPAGPAQVQSGNVLRTYRTAVAATGEYTAFHGGTVALGQAAIVTAMNRVSGIYETELSIRLQLVANNSQLVYTNSSTDPYTNNNANSLLTQNQSNIDSVIGNANYDIGHVFSTAGGGLAALGVVGITGLKAQGETGLAAPTGDAFYVDYVAHEMGHQFGADHTFNGDSGSCSGSNRNASTAYEPGSGSTIMAYAGICGNDDLQLHSDPYFHSASVDEIIAYVDGSIPGVGTRTATGNSIPTVNAGSNYTIPAQTPFTLTASGVDANSGDALTYDWEERDLGPQRDLSAADNGSSPLFRSFLPTTSPSRTFPRLPDLLNNTTSLGETMPALSRTMNFRVTVRDNRAGGGGINSDDMIVNVVNTGAAFAVTSPNTTVTWAGGSSQNVTWNVAGTTANGINAASVNILLSTDGGNTFPIVLAANTPNDGSQSIVVPSTATSSARIRVEAVGNIFFDVSNANFTITAPINGIDLYGSAFSVSPSNLIAAGGLADVNFTVGNQGNTAAPAFDVKFYLSDDATIDPASDTLLTLDPSGAYYDASEPSDYHVSGGLAAFGTTSAAIRVAVPMSDPFHTDNQYFIGMYVDADGNVAEADETNNRNRGNGLDRQSVVYSTAFTNPTSIAIPDSGNASPYPSNINVAGLAGTIADVNVSLSGFTHTFPDDVDVLLVGPAGQKMILLSDVGGGNDITGVNLVLDDAAANSLANSSQVTSGTYKPTNFGSGTDTFGSPAPASPYSSTLSVFSGTNPNGTWSLYVVDDSSVDTGSFSGGWGLTFVLTNTAPTNPGNVSLPAVEEDISDGSNTGFLVSTIVAGSGSSDPNGNPVGIAVTSVDDSHGQWQYSTNSGSSWQSLAGVSLTSARLLGPVHYVRFKPNSDFNSQIAASPTFGFKAWDQTAGAAGGTGDTTVGSAFSGATAAATLPITAVDDAPSFALASSTVTVNEDAGPVSVSGFATSIARGPAMATDEALQTLTFVVSVTGTTGSLSFDAAPSIDRVTGALSFTAASNTNGTATVGVVLQDSGSGTAPNVNVSFSQQFTIEVSAVNDAPSFALASETVSANEDAGAVSVSGFATNIAPGPATATDEAGQTLTVLVTVSGTTGTLSFDVAPSIDPVTGTLSFTAAANTNGTATIGVVLQDSGSGTLPNVNVSPNQQFTIEISAVNDAPSFALASATVSANEDAGAVSVNGFATNIEPGPATATDEAGQALVFLVNVIGTTSTLSFDVPPSINSASGDLSFTISANTSGTATIEVVLQDNGSGTSPNVNVSPTQQFSIEIAAVNDEQVLVANAGLVVDQGAAATITSAKLGATDIDNSPAELLYTITAVPSHGTILVDGTPATQFSQQQVNTGVVRYQNDGAANSTDSFEFAVDDGAGAASSGTFTVTIRPNPGDYDQNLVVEAADYVLWRKTLGATGVSPYSGADGDGDTTIDQDDYDVWRRNFGIAMPTGSGSLTSVDEGVGIAASMESRMGSMEGASSEVQGTTAFGLLRIADFRLRSGGSREIRIESREAEICSSQTLQPDDGLLAWLGSRNYQRKKDVGETHSVDVSETSLDAINDECDVLDVAFEAVALEIQ